MNILWYTIRKLCWIVFFLYVPLQCSQRCGAGFQLRVVRCTYPNWKITKDENCDPNSRPNNRRDCQVKPSKTTTTASNGNQLPSTTRARQTTTPAPTTPQEIPSWNEGSWSEVKKIVFFLIIELNVVMAGCVPTKRSRGPSYCLSWSRIFQGGGVGGRLVHWDCRISGACCQNVAIWELEPFWKPLH